MRSLLIGGNGLLGYELLGQLAALGEVVATTSSGRLADGGACETLDLRGTADLRAMVAASAAEIVINAAAYTDVDRAESERDTAFAVNATAPGVIAEACALQGVPLVHFSTDYVFPGTGVRPLLEDDPTEPCNAYGASKLAGEQAVRASGARCKIFRLCWLYGTRRKNFLLTALRLATEHDELRVVADQVGCPTPAAWIAKAVVRAVTTRPELSGTWHLAASGSTTWRAFAEATVEEGHRLGLLARRPAVRAITTAEYPTLAVRPAYTVFDCGRMEQDFGVRLPEWRSGVIEVVREIPRSKSARVS